MLIRIFTSILATVAFVAVFSGISFAQEAPAAIAPFGPMRFEDIPVKFYVGEEAAEISLGFFWEGNERQIESKKIYAMFPTIGKYPIDAKAYLDENEKLAISDEKNGTRIDLKKLEADIENAFETFDLKPIITKFELVPPKVRRADLEAVLPNLSELITQKITLQTSALSTGQAVTEKYTFDVRKNFDALDIQFTSYFDLGGRPIPVSMITEDALAAAVLKKDWVLGLATQKIDDYIKNELASDLEVPAENVTISIEEPEVKENDDWVYGANITFEGTAQNGLIVDKPVLINNLLLALNGNDKVAIIPLREVKAEIHAPKVLQDRGITELFSVGYSNFRGSTWKRVHNINVGIARFNGVLIPKNSVFSFNERLGPVDASTGYLEELVIKGDKTEPDYGGGLCQVSSTFFRAGLFGGLDIVERKAHSYAVSYYARPGGHGLDCTIYPGVSDCKIRNDSPGDLLIQAYTEGNDAYFKFYGTQDGRTVALDGPYYSNQAAAPPDKTIYDSALPADHYEEKEQPHNGFDAVWYRTVVNSAGEEVKHTFVSKYQARPRVILRGGSEAETIGGISSDAG